MYLVTKMCMGISEPWWFLEELGEGLIVSQRFDDYYEALKYYNANGF